MRVIDRLKPVLMGSLHNAGFGGVYYYISEDIPELYPAFHEIPEWEELPLALGEPEAPYIPELAPAIFGLIGSSATYDYLEQNGADLSTYSQGGSSAEYAAPYGTLTLIVEMPYFDDPRVNDRTDSETRRRDSILAGLDIADESYAVMQHLVKFCRGSAAHAVSIPASRRLVHQGAGAVLRSRTKLGRKQPGHRSASYSRGALQQSPGNQVLPAVDDGDTDSHAGGRSCVRQLRAMIRRTQGSSSPIRRMVRRARWGLDFRAIPIRKLVAVQLGAIWPPPNICRSPDSGRIDVCTSHLSLTVRNIVTEPPIEGEASRKDGGNEFTFR